MASHRTGFNLGMLKSHTAGAGSPKMENNLSVFRYDSAANHIIIVKHLSGRSKNQTGNLVTTQPLGHQCPPIYSRGLQGC